MSSADDGPEWYEEDRPLVDVVTRAGELGVPKERVVEVLGETEYENEPERRVRAIVDGTTVRIQKRRDAPRTSQPRRTDTEPVEAPNRRLDVADVAYLTSREFARLFRVVLDRFGGRVEVLETARLAVEPSASTPGDTAAPAERGVTLLEWEHEGETTVAGLVVCPRGERLTAGLIRAMAEAFGDAELGADRSVLVTNGPASAEAEDAAATVGVRIRGRDHLGALLALARIPAAVYGPVLEHGEEPTFDWAGLGTDLPDVPEEFPAMDPFDADLAGSSAPSLSVRRSREADPGEPGETTGKEGAPSTASSGPTEGDTVEVDPDALGTLQAPRDDPTTDDDAIDGLLSNLSG